MSSIDEKRVYGADTDATALFVASNTGVARVAVAGERIGEVALVRNCRARDLAVSEDRLAIATDEDVLVTTGESFEPTEFGPAMAVGFDEGLLAASPRGVVARRVEGDWQELGTIEEVRAIDGNLVASVGGVYRLADELEYAGLDDARDVTTAATPYVATGEGLYRLGNGWMEAFDGDFSMVNADGGQTDRAHAATAEGFYEHVGGEWTVIDGIEKPVVGVAYAGGVYAVCADGTLLVEADEGWREHPLGVGETRAIVAGPADRKPV